MTTLSCLFQSALAGSALQAVTRSSLGSTSNFFNVLSIYNHFTYHALLIWHPEINILPSKVMRKVLITYHYLVFISR